MKKASTLQATAAAAADTVKKTEVQEKKIESAAPAAKAEADAKKTEAPKAEAPAKKADAPKTEATAKKAAAKKTPAKEIKSAIYVQFAGKEYTEKALVAAAKKAYVALGNKAADIKTIDLYVKTEENVAYYAVNGVGSDDYKIVL